MTPYPHFGQPAFGIISAGRLNYYRASRARNKSTLAHSIRAVEPADIRAGSTLAGARTSLVVKIIGTARAAVAVHPDAGDGWMSRAGLSTPRSTQRRYIPAQKAEFLRRLMQVKNVSAVARELGINRVTAHVWAHKRGPLPPRTPTPSARSSCVFVVRESRGARQPERSGSRHTRRLTGKNAVNQGGHDPVPRRADRRRGLVLRFRRIHVPKDKLMITDDDARARAEELLDEAVRPWLDDEVVVNASATVRTERHWVFFYNAKTYLETGSVVHALAGNGPVIVSAEDGTARLASSATPWEDQI